MTQVQNDPPLLSRINPPHEMGQNDPERNDLAETIQILYDRNGKNALHLNYSQFENKPDKKKKLYGADRPVVNVWYLN